MRFNPAPGWPSSPPGWIPPAGWQPDSSWPPAPPGWQFWMPANEAGDGGVPGAVGPDPASGRAHPDAQPADPDLARVWVAEITRLAERRRANRLSRVTLIAPPVKGGLLGRILAIGVGAALGGGINDAALDAADQADNAHGAVRLPDTCLLCGLLPGAVTDTADITVDASTLGFFLGGELLSQQKSPWRSTCAANALMRRYGRYGPWRLRATARSETPGSCRCCSSTIGSPSRSGCSTVRT